jgi:hypothetical protein
MPDLPAEFWKSIEDELKVIWMGHHAVGLKGYMCLYTDEAQDPWRAKKGGLQYWFDEIGTIKAVEEIKNHYNNGNLPNSPLLLNPIVHEKKEDETYVPIGSGIIWCSSFALGIEELKSDQLERMRGLGVFASKVHRGDSGNSGLKMLAFSDKKLIAKDGLNTVNGCNELFELANVRSPDYKAYYILSGIQYLCKHGMYTHPDFKTLFEDKLPDVAFIKKNAIPLQRLVDAAYCWDAYDRHHSLFSKFGIDPTKVETNLKFYYLCARDIELFDATGAKHAHAETAAGFDFLVHGWVPRGAVTVIGATGGTGKSSVAHNLAVKAAIDYRPDEAPPTWLGQPLVLANCKGICIYFSGEDGPAIVHSRAKVFDPEGRAQRVMFQRTDFGEGGNLGSFLKRLHKLPEVPLIVIDPARKYLTGDENDASVVSEFFEAIEEFAIRKNAAMVVVHHLVKGAKVKHVSEIYDMLRGSQVFIDRPRVVIGMYREGNFTVAGLSKNNIPPQMGMVQGERLFVRDAKRLELVAVPPPEGIRGDTLTEEEIEAMRTQE